MIAPGVLFASLLATAAAAGPQRARLSRDLAEHLKAASSASVDVIVAGTTGDIRTLAARYGAKVKKPLKGGAVLEVTGGQLDAIAQDPDVRHLSGDVKVYRTMAVTAESTGASQVWAGLDDLPGFDGQGIGVAVVDSGVATHQALKGRVVASVDFTGSNGHDRYGHGTHVASIIAGSGAGGYGGVAPGAHLVSLKVLEDDGSGYTSDVINAIDWAVENRARFNIRIVNLSLGHPVLESYRDDPLCQAVERAVQAGLVVVAAAGNRGKTDDGRPIVGGIISPGNSPAALTVGAINTKNTPQRSDDVMATYSSRGPTAIDGLLKPELVAPGNKIAAAAAPGAYLTKTYPERVVSGAGSHGYIALSGTSMSAAVVSGAAALLLQANPRLTPFGVRILFQLTASDVSHAGLIEAGTGSVNALSAVSLVVGSGGESTIAGEMTKTAGFAFLSFESPVVGGETLVWGDATTLVWGDATTLVWGDATTLVWGDATTLVWGDATTLVWGDAKTLVWGDATTLVWGDATTLVWGDTLHWGD